ncbi:peptidase inhibitor family I36 protein [Streptomyces sp. NPDC014894]|uniref:peptidase inhibitor family I36 protein n=1 Tax=unclassified Streptomyces TaxID=2593676 RepID=UPI003700020A
MRRTALIAAAVTVFAALAAAPASAGPSPWPPPRAAPAASVAHFAGSDCPAGALCLYRDRDFTGGGIALGPDTYVERLGDHGFDDRMSSWSNDTGQVCDWWTDEGRGGVIHDIRDGYRVNVLPGENDTASSVECW